MRVVSGTGGVYTTLSSSRGFTLLELLVAVAIFAVLAAMAYGGLQMVVNARERTEAQMQRLAELQTAFTVLARDIEQTVARGVRDEFGDSLPAMLAPGNAREDEGVMIELTRMGWRNPAGRARSHLQRVAYVVEDDALVRRYWQVLDRTQGSEPLESVLVEDIKGVEARFLGPDAQWTNQWPPLTAATPTTATTSLDVPRVVEITFETEDWDRITRLFRVPSSS